MDFSFFSSLCFFSAATTNHIYVHEWKFIIHDVIIFIYNFFYFNYFKIYINLYILILFYFIFKIFFINYYFLIFNKNLIFLKLI